LTPSTIPESTITALTELLVRMVNDDTGGTAENTRISGDVRRALRNLCEDARTYRVRVEQLVIAIKQGWSSLHSEHPRARADGPDVMLNQVVTLCIDEYYSSEQRA
jgi:hypothetical protein